MSTEPKKYRELSILAAEYGGFVIYEYPPERNMHMSLVYAGGLKDCLSFMERNLQDRTPEPAPILRPPVQGL